jgi:hypothetical protein
VTIRKPRQSPRASRLACSLLLCLVQFSLAPTILHSALQKPGQPYAVIFGTVWGPDNRPIYGVHVKIRRATDKPKKVRWDQYSDHSGEFAQHVPAGEADYILSADPKDLKLSDGTQLHLPEEVKVHIYNDEREDTGLHLTR